jgi:phosphoglycerate dehydrogenase-like enzyme
MMGDYKTLITVPYMQPDDPGDRHLRQAGVETLFSLLHGHRSEDEMIRLLDGIDAAIVGLDPFTAKVMDASPRLKVISRSGVGYDDIDVPAATARGIAVCTTPGLNHNTVAEYTMALMLQCARKLVENLNEGRRGGWAWSQGRDLAGRTLGIVGLGAIGKQVAKRARAFEMTVLAYDIAQDAGFAAQHVVRYVSLEELLRGSDYISVHLFLDGKSHHMVNAARLALMKPTAYLINTSRGGVIDSAALYQALKEKRIAGAALDVFEKEPLEPDSPLRTLDNLYISPHCSGASDDSRNAQVVMAAENVLRILEREKPVYILNPEVLGSLRR